MVLRQEQSSDHHQVFSVVERAFRDAEYTDHNEQFLVQRLRKSDAFIPQLSLVADIDGHIVGHILLTKIKIKNNSTDYASLALAPVSVLPAYQGRGIGRALILEAHDRAKNLGHKSIVLLGHKDYYTKLGYTRADSFGIHLPFDVPKENCMAIELVQNGLQGVSGMVEYPKEFEL